MFKIILLTSFAATAWAQNTAPVDLLNQAQGYVGAMSAPVADPLCENCSAENLFKSCVQDVCSKSDIKKNYLQLKQDQFLNISAEMNAQRVLEISGELSKLTTDLLNAEVDYYLLKLKRYKEALDNNESSSNDTALQFMIAMELGGLLKEEDKANLPPALRIKAEQANKIFITQIARHYNPYMDTPELHYRLAYPNMDVRTAILNDVKKFEELKNKLKANPIADFFPSINESLDDFYNSDFYKKIKSNADFDISEASELLETNFGLNAVIAFIEDPEFQAFQKTINPADIRALMGSNLARTNLHALIDTMNDFKTSKRKIEEYVTYCTNNFLNAYTNLPSNETKSKLKAISNEIKDNLNKTVLSKLSQESRSKLLPAVNSWEFTTLSREDFLTKVKNDLRSSTRDNRASLELDKKMGKEESLLEVYTNMSVLNYNSQNEREFLLDEVFGDLGEICVSDIPSPLNDAAYTSLGVIRVSWGSLQDLDAGRAIMAHELGHKLSGEIKNLIASKSFSTNSSGIYNLTNACLEAKQGSKLYIEEDFADTISSLVEGPEGNNTFCFFPMEYNNNPLKNTDEEDTHSADFFRLLHVEKSMRGILPPTCDQYLKRSPTQRNLNSCWNGGSL